MNVNDKYSLKLDEVIPFSTTPRYLFADHITGEGDSEKFRLFVTHTQSP